MHNRLIEIETNKNLLRDMNNHAVINIDNAALNSYLTQREKFKQMKETSQNLETRISNLESSMSEIKQMLSILVNRK